MTPLQLLMADPLSIIGGIAAILQTSSTISSLIKTVKGASEDRQKLLGEINAAAALCQTLLDYAEIDPRPWTQTFQLLCVSRNGPIEQFRAIVDFLQKKLKPAHNLELDHKRESGFPSVPHRTHITSWAQSLKWPFTKEEVKQTIKEIERLKSLFTVALTNDSVLLTAAMREEVAYVSKGVDVIRDNQESEKRKQSLARLSTIDFEAAHHDVSSNRVVGSGHWILNSEEFRAWLDSDSNKTLWCRGIPGAGKTILSSLIIDHLRRLGAMELSMGVAGIYCTYRDPQTVVNLLGSLLQQLASGLSDLPQVLCNDEPLTL